MERKKHFDLPLFLVLMGLLLFGLLMIFSTSIYNASQGEGASPYSYFNKQMLAEVGGIIAIFLIVFFVPYKWIYLAGRNHMLRRLLLIISAGLMFLLFIPGLAVTVNGATRWIRLGPVNMQPAEVVKAAVIIYMAGYISEDTDRINTLKGYIKALIVPGFLAGLVYIISDNMSSAIIIMGIAVTMIFMASKDWVRQLLVYGGGVALVAFAALEYVKHADPDQMNFRFKRLMIWKDPEAYIMEEGYQTVQALYAIGSGGVNGKGIGRSVQKLGVIPEVHNDMIFSVVCEELGLWGAALLMILFAVLLGRCATIAAHTKHTYGKMLVVGIMMQIAIQTILNILVVTNTMPNTGVSLPFISYGGSSAAFLLAEMGLVLKVGREEEA